MASELNSTAATRVLRYETMSKIWGLSRGSPMPCSTTRSRAGNCSAIIRTRSSVRSAGGSSVSNVRMHVWHFESHRLVVSRYSERGKAPTTAGRDG